MKNIPIKTARCNLRKHILKKTEAMRCGRKLQNVNKNITIGTHIFIFIKVSLFCSIIKT